TIKKNALPKIRKVLGSSRQAQLRGVDWSRMAVHGHISLGGGEYEREENMSLGRYFEEDDVEAIAQAYLNGNDAGVQSAVDRAMSNSYIGDGATKLTDVSRLW